MPAQSPAFIDFDVLMRDHEAAVDAWSVEVRAFIAACADARETPEQACLISQLQQRCAETLQSITAVICEHGGDLGRSELERIASNVDAAKTRYCGTSDDLQMALTLALRR